VSNITELGSAQITSTERLVIVLSEPDDMPVSVVVHWPSNPCVIDPKIFGDTAAAVVKLFSEAHVTLAGIKARRRRR
jgi:hypothetical protein